MQSATLYHIVKFPCRRPYPSCSEYECVPQSWVRFHDPKKEAAIISYPNRAVDAEWKKFAVKVIFSTENYEEARVSLQLFQSDTSTTPEDTHTVTDSVTRAETSQPSPTIILPPAVALQHTPQNTANTPAQTKVRADQVSEQKAKLGPKRKSIKEPEIVIKLQSLPDIDHKALQKLEEIEALFKKSQKMLLKLKDTDTSVITNRIDNVLKRLDNQCKAPVKNEDTQNTRFIRHMNTVPVRNTTKKINKSGNSRWMLRYPRLKPGLVELIPKTRVYVDEENLKIYKTATKSSDLVRALLCEIFSDEALLQCSVSGKQLLKKPRPGLDSHGKNALIQFVKQFAKERNWEDMTDFKIMKCLYNKLHHIRRTKVVVNHMLENWET